MNRSDYIGSSDAKRILDGDWLALYQEKIGERPPEDLTHNFPVQLGVHTEKFHLDWLGFHEGFDIRQRGHVERMNDGPIAATIDGWSKGHDTFVEVKHSNGRADRNSMVEWYQPQIAHMCNVFNVKSGILSYIAGNAAPDWFTIEPSERYREALLEMELAFWWHIENREPPNVTPIAAARVEEIKRAVREVKLDGMRTVDMNLNNQWAVHATDYLLNEGAAGVFEKAKKDLKAMVEPDVREARGMGICIKRSKAGSLTISMEK